MERIKENYIPSLDGLRTLAVFAVVAYHLNASWMPGGLLGVNLFFVLSGYLITSILLNQWTEEGTINLKEFWLRRARRLLPALFTMLAGVLLWLLFFAPERLAALKWETVAAVFYTGNWYLIFHQVSYFESFGPPSPLGHLWSLAIEEQFYLLWPILAGLGLRYFKGRKMLIRGTVAVAVISAMAMALMYMPGQDPSRVYYGTDTRVFALLIGALPAMVRSRRRGKSELTFGMKVMIESTGGAGLLIILLMLLKTNQYQTFLYQGGLVIFSLAAAVVVISLSHPASSLGRVFGSPLLRWLGQSSYGIYLWHYPVIVLTTPAVNTGETGALHIFLQIIVTILLATLSRYLIEEPIRYGRWSLPPMPAAGKSNLCKPITLRLRIFVSLLLGFSLVFAMSTDSLQTSANDLTAYQEVEKQENVEHKEAEYQSDEQQKLSDEQQKLSDEQQKLSDGALPIKGEEITIISDSIMINAIPAMEALLPDIIIDAKISRQMHQAPEVIKTLKREGKLRGTVILGLGTNGAFTEKQLIEVLDCLADAERIILINTRVPRPWESAVNETFSKVLNAYPEIMLIDWHAASRGQDGFFKSDGVHLNEAGVKAYTEVIMEALSSIENLEQ